MFMFPILSLSTHPLGFYSRFKMSGNFTSLVRMMITGSCHVTRMGTPEHKGPVAERTSWEETVRDDNITAYLWQVVGEDGNWIQVSQYKVHGGFLW
jgi:hypothetical protein